MQPGALSAELLQPFAPVGYEATAMAYDLGFPDQGELLKMVRENLFSTEPRMLRTFLETASYIDRHCDISEELQRLACDGTAKEPPLWMLIARLILQRYQDRDSALATLEQLYQWCDTPEELRPYTLFGRLNVDGRSHSEDMVRELDAMLRGSGV